MPVHRQPLSLVDLSKSRVCGDLDRACRELQALTLIGSSVAQVLEYTKRVVRPYYVNLLPGIIRSELIEKTSKSLYGRGNEGAGLLSGPTPLYLLTILLGPDIKRLKINLCCYYGCTHQADIFRLLSTEGTGVQSLELARSSLLRLDCQLLGTALKNMKNLQSLTMKNIATDTVLEVIGRTCPKLIVLDVNYSKQVTDVGLQQLLVRLHVSVHKEPTNMANRQTTVDNRNDRSRHRHHQSTTWSRIKALLAKLRVKDDKDDRKYLLDVNETRNAICGSLKVLNVAKTGVTNAGVSMALEHLPNLESLADYCPVSRVVEIKNRDFCKLRKSLSLKIARDNCTTIERLEILAKTCPGVEKLWIENPRHPAVALRAFPSLTSLTIDFIPADKNWIDGFYDYLRTDGAKLCELNMRLVRCKNAPEIDMRKIFVDCPNLVNLTKEGSPVVWSDGEDPVPLRQLKRVQIGDIVTAKTIVKILQLAPELVSLHAHSCNELTDQHLEILHKSTSFNRRYSDQTNNFVTANVVKNLTCFYVDEANKISATCVINMFKHCENLRHIGNLVNWGLNHDEMRIVKDIVATRNIDVELCPVAHWFWNTCSTY